MKKLIHRILKSPWFWLILAGYILRIIVMPITGQHDVMFMPWMTRYVNQGHFNLYAFLYEKYGSIVMRRPGVWAPYPYGFYIFTAGWLGLLEQLGLVDVVTWERVWQIAHPARYVFLFKLAYLPFDFGIGYMLYRAYDRMGLTLWAWSSLAIYTPFMMGQNDIYSTAFAVAGTYAAMKAIQVASQNPAASSWFPNKWTILSSICLGIGSIFKLYPLFLLSPLVLIIEKRWWQRVMLLGIGCSILGLASLPFITTPTYVNGVLFNPEGAEIFREIQLFGISVSPFLLSYLILILYLIMPNGLVDDSKHLPWFVSLIVLSLLFLWVPTPLYWLIWIVPFLIGVMGKVPRLSVAWILLHVAFAFMILNEHQELGVALPIHLASIFNVPNLSTALTITHPTIYQAFVTLLPLVKSLLVASLLYILHTSVIAVVRDVSVYERKLKPHWWIGLPTATLLSGLIITLFFSRNLVSPINRYDWQSQTLTAGDHVIQELSPEHNKITGLRLRFIDVVSPATIEACIYGGDDINQEPIACAAKSTSEEIGNRNLYFLFGDLIYVEESVTATFELKGDGANVVLPYTTSADKLLQFNDMTSNGSLDVSTLSPFDVAEAFDTLILENVLQDPYLLMTMAVTLVLAVLFVGRLVVVS